MQAIVVDFVKGTSTAAPRRPIHLAHAAFMLIGWGILLPIGVMVARFTKRVKVDSKVGHSWPGLGFCDN
jgi:hypothetical protein